MEKQPFYLQPPPPGKYRIIKYNDYDMDEDMNTDTAGNVDVMNEKYYHESDAFEKV
jgi:hypothetical protein